jgi:hypothetical protein
MAEKIEVRINLDSWRFSVVPVSFLQKGLAAISRLIRRKSLPLVEETAESIKETILESFKLPKTGRIYRLKGGLFYKASAPGEPPAIKTGALYNAVEVKTTMQGAEIIIDRPYARRLEIGDKNLAAKGAILPRPYVLPAIMAEEKSRRGILRMVNQTPDS